MGSWEEQIAGERAAGQPLDEEYFRKVTGRHNSHRNRCGVGWELNQPHTFVATDTWESISTTWEIYIPPWASKLVATFGMALWISNTDPNLGPHGGRVRHRFTLSGGTVSSISKTGIGCKTRFTGPPNFELECVGACNGCDGDETQSGITYTKSCVFTFDPTDLDTVQTVTLQFERNITNVTSCEYNRDHIYRPWYWSE